MIILHFDLQPQFKYMSYFINTSHRTYLFRVKYVVCPPTKVALYLTELFSSTVSLSFPSLAAKNTYGELDINIVCELIFFERQNHNESEVFMHSFRG